MMGKRPLTSLVAGVFLIVLSALPANASAFEEVSLEDQATCDFEGDGFIDYSATEGQTVLQKTLSWVDGQGITHVQGMAIFDGVEYTGPSEETPIFYLTGRGTMSFQLDADETILDWRMRGAGTYTDEAGNVLYQGPANFDIILIDGKPVDFVTRGPVPPCVPGFILD